MSKNLSAKYYQENKERLQKKLVKDIKIFLKKTKYQQFGRERYKNLSEDEKNKLVEYRNKYYRMRKSTLSCSFIRKSIRNFFPLRLRLKTNIKFFRFSGLASSLLKYKKFFKLEARKFHFPKYKKHFKSCFFFFIF